MYDSSHINRFVKCKRQIWKMMTKKMSLLLTGMLLCLAPDIKGNETDGRIKGIVMDGELGGPLEFVTVQVKAKGSDKILQGAVTGSDGNYSIGGLKKGEYIVTYSYIGYAEISKNITISNNSQTLNLGELTLEEDANQLGEVEIVAKKPQMRFELDRKVFDATQDIASEGGSASDLLANIPSVEVDNEGSVSFQRNSLDQRKSIGTDSRQPGGHTGNDAGRRYQTSGSHYQSLCQIQPGGNSRDYQHYFKG